jgi:hypothetical protein
MIRVAPADFRRLPLRVHTFLADVPLRDVSATLLPGGGASRTVADVRTLLSSGAASANGLTKLLFALRWKLGRLFRWDDADRAPGESYAARLTPDDRANSRRPVGESDGEFLSLYEFERESLGEVRNATVHAFLCTALCPVPDGYMLYLAVYVQPVSWLTAPYMTLIEPFRRFVVYPAMLRRIREEWARRYVTR